MEPSTKGSYSTRAELDQAIAAARRKARSLVGRVGVNYGDRDDLEQDLHVALIEAIPKFDPNRGSLSTFASHVIERRSASLVRRHRAQKRNGRGVRSLNVDVFIEDEGRVELAATISKREHNARLKISSIDPLEHADLCEDVDGLLTRIPSQDRELIHALKWRTLADLSRSMGVPRTTLQSRIRKYRQLFEDAGLAEYLR